MQGTGAAIAGGSQRRRLGACQAEDRTAQDEHTELERSVEQLRHNQATRTWRRRWSCCSQRADALRQERADRLMYHAEMQHRLQCMTPSLSKAGRRLIAISSRSSSSSTSWHHRGHIVHTLEPPCNRRSFTITSARKRSSKW